MLLLTSLAFGGSEAVEAYAHLDSAEEELLRHRASALLQIPRDKRVPVLVQEIKRLVTQRRRQLASAEPKRLAQLLRKERGALVEVVLNALPADLATAVRSEMGNPPGLKLLRDVKPEVLSIIRWKIEDALRATGPQIGSFRFTDLMTMQQREVLAVADRMGARVLATAIAGLAEQERASFLGQLPPDQKALAARAAEAGGSRRLTEKDARLVLEMHGALENPSLGMRSAGAQRIIRACYAQGGEFAQRFAQRHGGELGKLLARWLKEEKAKPVKGDGGRLDIVEQFERLAQKGIVDRPMRLPPPARPPPVLHPVTPKAAPRSSTPNPSRVLVAPPQRRPSTGAMPPAESAPPRRPSSGAPAARRDPMAERAARRAGAASPGARKPLASSPPTDSQLRAQRVLRDGKPLETQPPRPRASSAIAPLPKRKEPLGGNAPRTGPHRSPVLKGSRRGPSGGSR